MASTATSNLRYVTTEGVRLRKAPAGEVVRELTLAEAVEVVGETGEAGWLEVRAADRNGVVFGTYLREPARPAVEALVQTTVGEWVRFDKGRGDERTDPYRGYVGEMWRAIGQHYDGASLYPDGKEVPWSAAFISWVVRHADVAYANFLFADGHSKFVNDAIMARVTGRRDKPFWGYRITEAKPALGDIIQRNRLKGSSFSFSYAENHEKYASHSDIVVEVRSDVVRTIGGNVSDTVSRATSLQEYALDADGFLRPGQRVIALLKNRAGLEGELQLV